MVKQIFLTILLISSLVISGCAATSVGNRNVSTIRESPEVSRKYRSLTIDPNYIYYFSGPESQPDAIMGLEERYTVQSKFWHQVDLTEEQLDFWVKWGDRQNADEGFSRRYMGRYQGAFIVDLQGEVIGDWFSKKDKGVFEFPGNDIVIAYPPQNRAGSDYRRF